MQLSELKNIEKTYDKGGRLVCLCNGDSGLNGNYNIDNDGRFLGVKK